MKGLSKDGPFFFSGIGMRFHKESSPCIDSAAVLRPQPDSSVSKKFSQMQS
jgi:hypothetical protein